MAVPYNTLGSGRVAVIINDPENPRYKNRLSDVMAVGFPDQSQITAREGIVKFSPRESIMATEGTNYGPLGDDEDTPLIRSKIAERKYKVRRYALAEAYPKKLAGDQVFDHVVQTMAPKVRNHVTFQVDNIVKEIVSGAGTNTGDSSRDVTLIDLTAAEWSTGTTSPLTAMQSALDTIGRGPDVHGVISDDVASALQSHPEIVQSILGTDTSRARVTRTQLVEFLRNFLQIGDLMIGMRQFQSGTVEQALDVQFMLQGVCYFGVKGNISKIPWSDLEGDEYEDNSKQTVNVRATEWCDIIVLDKSLSVAFTNILA